MRSERTSPKEELHAAICGLSKGEFVRLRSAAMAFDQHRHEDLLQEAISRTLSGERRWHEGVAFYWHLHEAMRSIAWNWHKKQDERLVLESQSEESSSGAGLLAETGGTTDSPERQLDADLMLERIIETCAADPIVLALVKGKLQGKTGRELREELNLDEKDFNAAAQRLRRSAKALVRKQRYA